MVNSKEILVECRSDYDYAGRPTAITWKGRRETVEIVIGTWRSPVGKHFRVITSSELVFDCIYSEVENSWDINEL